MISLNDVFIKACQDVGVDLVSYYPITPATVFTRRCEQSLNTVMAEDEIAAINIAIGASIIGKKACVVTSGPGLNLMTETINYAFMAEIPIVIFDFQRAGPATGIPVKTIEQDELYINHCIFGIDKNPIFKPKTQKEIYKQTIEAFKLAEELKRPIFILSNFEISATYETEEELKRKKIDFDIKRKDFYTGLFSINGKISEDTDLLKQFLEYKQYDMVFRM